MAMMTTSDNLNAGRASNVQRGNGATGRRAARARLAKGATILGCAAALVFGGLRGAAAPRDAARAIPSPHGDRVVASVTGALDEGCGVAGESAGRSNVDWIFALVMAEHRQER